jgi:hypothetical protein
LTIRTSKVKLFIIIVLVLVFCFVPLVNMPYEVVVRKLVPEVYATIEPYTVREEVRVPYETCVWQKDYEGRQICIPITKYKTSYEYVTKYRQVTKRGTFYRSVVETRTRRVSILRYLLG